MRVTRLKVTNLRVINSAEFPFQPGFNLVVGVNGVGKTSVLDALSVCLSAVVKRTNDLRGSVGSFAVADIRVGANALTIECGFRIGLLEYGYVIHQPRETSAPQKRKAGRPREQVHHTPEIAEFVGAPTKPATGDESDGRPLAVLFSTRRAIPSERAPARSVAVGGIAAGFAEAFTNRELRLGEFAAWMRVQRVLGSELAGRGRVLHAIQDAVERFLPGYTHLRVSPGKRRKLLIDHGSATLEVRQLSDGERGSLAIVLDLTRRLAQANPKMIDPAAQAEAVVLIDEIDLHLHPKWQRRIIGNLTAVFPKCQFIATTHSPQIVAAVEPERVLLLTAAGVVRPDRTLGMDSNWILRHIMEADDRPKGAAKAIRFVEAMIKKGAFKKARTAIGAAKRKGLDLPEWSVLEARMARLEVLTR